MSRQSLLVIYLGNRKFSKEPRRRFSISTAGQREPLRLLERQHVERTTWIRLFLRASPRITDCNAAGGNSEIRRILAAMLAPFNPMYFGQKCPRGPENVTEGLSGVHLS